jgi:RNA-directed DNA polymerase
MKNKREKSDPSIVAQMSANKPGQPGAESAEPREGTEGNAGEQHTCRTQSRESVSQGLERVREVAKQDKKERFTSLLHQVTIDLLKDAYSWLKREAAPGVDGRTWRSYKENLEVNLTELIFQCGDPQRALPPVGFRDVPQSVGHDLLTSQLVDFSSGSVSE